MASTNITFNDHRLGHNVVRQLISAKCVMLIQSKFADSSRTSYKDWYGHPFYDSLKVEEYSWDNWRLRLDKTAAIRVTVYNPTPAQKVILNRVNTMMDTIGEHSLAFGQTTA